MNTVLACVDFSETTTTVLATAIEIARAFDARVRLVHMVSPLTDSAVYAGDGRVAGWVSPPQDEATKHQREKASLLPLEEAVRAAGLQVQSVIVEGVVVDEVLTEAELVRAKMIVVGSHGRSALLDVIMRSATSRVARRACCPVVVAPSPRRASERPSHAA
jgi:nucleotide-binding universal stress UspA family protein